MSYQDTKRHRENLNVYCQMKEANLKRLCYNIIPSIGHLEKGKTIETVERPVVAMELRERKKG